MPETLVYTSWQDWVDRAESPQRLEMFAPGDTELDHPRVTKAEAEAIGTMEGYLRRRGYRTPLDVPLPPEVKANLISLGFGYLTMRSENRVDNIDKNARDAKSYFKDISLGHLTIIDLVPATAAGTAELDLLYSHRDDDFDFSNPESIGSRRMPPL